VDHGFQVIFDERFHIPGHVRAELRPSLAVPVQAIWICAPDGWNTRALALPRSRAPQVLGFAESTEQDNTDQDGRQAKFGINAEVHVDLFIFLSFASHDENRSRNPRYEGFYRALFGIGRSVLTRALIIQKDKNR
jgi:hypothetical protein